MTPDAIQKIVDLAAPIQIDHGDLTYSSKAIYLIRPPEAEPLKISTLQGLVDLFDADFDGAKSQNPMLHIVDPKTVQLAARDTNDYANQRIFAVASYPAGVATFPFGQWLQPDKFIVAAHVGFQRVQIEKDDGTMAEDLDYVLKIASKISAGQERIDDDDGISQFVQVKAGVHLNTEAKLKPIVNLAAYRTFAEIDQVISRFILRAHGDDNGAQLALFEADGGRWRLDAVAAIASWLKAKFPTDVPIIS